MIALFLFVFSTLLSNTWTSPEQLSNIGNTTDDYYVAMDANGNGMGVWYDEDDEIIYYSLWDGSSWSANPIELYDTEGNILPDELVLTMNATGQAILTASDGDANPFAIYAWYYNGSSWSSATELSDDGVNAFCALSDNGTGLAVWESSSLPGGVFAKSFDGTSWDSSETRINASGQDGDSAYVVMDSSGNACATWTYDTGGIDQVHAAFYQSGSWGPPTTISDTDVHSQLPTNWTSKCISMNDNGEVLVCFVTESEGGIAYAYYNGSAWNDPVQVFTGDSDTLSITIDGNGVGFIAWDSNETGDEGIRVRKIVNGTAESVVDIVDSDDSRYPTLASLDQGGVILLYQFETNLYAAIYNGTSWGSGVNISSTEDVSNEFPVLALSNTGTAIAMIEAGDDLLVMNFTPSALTTAPTVLSAVQKKNGVVLTWDAPSGATGLQVYDAEQDLLLSSPTSNSGSTFVQGIPYKAGLLKIRSVSPFNQKSPFTNTVPN